MTEITYRASVEAEPPAAGRIAQALDETETPQALSVSYFDLGNAHFEVSALYAERPDEAVLTSLIDEAAAGDAVTPLRIEEVSPQNWVTISQGQRGPVRAGRFLIHGGHDRENVARSRFTIEIDADQAFGTANHASTRGCLLMLDALAKRGRPDLVLDLGTGSGILAIAAALAFDRPVVATDVAGVREVLGEAAEPQIADPDDPQGFAAKVTAILAQGDLAKRLGEANRRRAAEQFTFEAMVAAYENLYAALLAGKA